MEERRYTEPQSINVEAKLAELGAQVANAMELSDSAKRMLTRSQFILANVQRSIESLAVLMQSNDE